MKKIFKYIKRIVIFLIIILLSIVMLGLLLEFDSQRTSTNIGSVGYRLKKFREKCGRFPNNTEGLDVLNTQNDCYNFQNYGGFMEMKNGYGTPFIYKSTNDGFELVSKSKFSDFRVTDKD